jgi:phytoene dehydrogenase-like protein
MRGSFSEPADRTTSFVAESVIVTGAPVQRVLLEGKKAVGVESNGNKCEDETYPAQAPQ